MSQTLSGGKPAPVLVAAAVLIRDGRVLITQRKAGTHLAGLWEFPGGKVEAEEDPRSALVRELREEVGVKAQVGRAFDVVFHRYPSKSVLLLFYEVSLASDSPEPQALDVAAVRWAAHAELRDDEFPPADVDILAQVRARLREGR